MKQSNNSHHLLSGIGARVRSLRQTHELTVRELALRANLSQRFVSQIEAGDANVSIVKLNQVAHALNCTVTDLIVPSEQDHSARARTWRMLNQGNDQDWQALIEWLEKRNGAKPEPLFIALIGLRGAGKSTVGPMLAKRLKTEFIELDQWVEEAAGLSLAQIFATHGESYYRQLERKALTKVFATSTRCVFAVGGSVVEDTAMWNQIKHRCFTVWLHATPQEFMKRMVKAGETRLTQRPTVMTDLKALLTRREPLYAESVLTIKTTGKTPAAVTAAVLAALAENRKH